MNRADLQRLSRLRLQEARSLLRSGHSSGAYYLAGYAIESALKACIAKETKRYDFPDRERVLKSYTHKPAELLKIAELSDDLLRDAQNNPRLKSSWEVVVDWSEQSRYSIWSRADAHAIIDAVGRPREGVLPWLTRHW